MNLPSNLHGYFLNKSSQKDDRRANQENSEILKNEKVEAKELGRKQGIYRNDEFISTFGIKEHGKPDALGKLSQVELGRWYAARCFNY